MVLLWHMHQPEYRDVTTGEYRLPWTYLHAIKDYVDMAAHLERYEGARAVVNFAPILLEQLEDYGRRIQANLEMGEKIPDTLLSCLVSDDFFIENDQNRLWLIQACLRANDERLVKRYPIYDCLVQMAQRLTSPESVSYLYRQYFIDLVVWYHLAWMGETVKRENPLIKRLIEKGRQFSHQDRRELLSLIGQITVNIIPSYRTLMEAGKVELSMSPYAHPMLPLLIDFESTREAMPDAPLPEAGSYPGGPERVQWHIDQGLAVFERCFGTRPQGCWPSEGGVSDATIRELDTAGFKWLATGDNVLNHSLIKQGLGDDCRHQAFVLKNTESRIFFRDDGLSDLIGFTYSSWHADDAINDLLQHIHTIRDHCEDQNQRIVSIILDGENAWEYYPENGYYLLDTLYRRLSEDEGIHLTTYSDYMAQQENVQNLDHVVAGSWVYGTFSTWIGDPDKNRAWDLLCQAKKDIDPWLAQHPEHDLRDKVLNQLAICEGSDWFWWFGDYNPSESVKDFDTLFRLNLTNLYALTGLPVPDALSLSLSAGNQQSGAEAGGVMRRGGE